MKKNMRSPSLARQKRRGTYDLICVGIINLLLSCFILQARALRLSRAVGFIFTDSVEIK